MNVHIVRVVFSSADATDTAPSNMHRTRAIANSFFMGVASFFI
jgi:hypothetical protein